MIERRSGSRTKSDQRAWPVSMFFPRKAATTSRRRFLLKHIQEARKQNKPAKRGRKTTKIDGRQRQILRARDKKAHELRPSTGTSSFRELSTEMLSLKQMQGAFTFGWLPDMPARFMPHIIPRNGFGREKSWSEWQDLNLRPPRPERGSTRGIH
jgi:hypothetical protein